MKAILRVLCCALPFILPVLADDPGDSPSEALRQQLQLFDSAASTTARLAAASRLARLIRAEGRDEAFYLEFRRQAEADPAATAPLIALSECLREWQCLPQSADLLAEAAVRQPDDLELQVLLAERHEQAGAAAKAAPILIRLVADHRSPAHLRRLAAFLFRTGDIDQAATLASQLAQEATDARQPEALAQDLLSLREWDAAHDFLSPLLTKFPADWRLAYLHACALERLSPDATAFAAFRALLAVRAEIPGFIPPANDTEEFKFFNSPQRQQYLSSLTPEDAVLARYRATSEFSPSDRSRPYLFRLANNPPKLLTPGEISELFHLRQLVRDVSAAGATFLDAFAAKPTPTPPPRSAARLELLKILGEKPATPAPATPSGFKITDPAAFLAAVATLDSPFHRVVILHACKLDEPLRQTLAELTKPEAAPTGALLLWASAYQAAERHDLPLAYDLASRARTALGPDHQAAADAQLVTLGLLLLKEQGTTPDLAAAKSAALRLSRFAVEESCRKALAGFFKACGDQETAAQLARPHFITTLRARSSSPPRTSPLAAAAAATPADKPAALRQLYRHLRAAQHSGRLSRTSMFSPNETIQSIRQLNLTADLAAVMLPPSGASYQRRRDYAIIMAKLDGPAKVLPLLDALQTEQPADSAILSLRCVAVPPERRTDLLAQLARTAGDDLSCLGAALELNPNGIENAAAYRAVLATWHTIPALLEAIPPDQSTTKRLAWLNEAAMHLAASSSVVGHALPSFGDHPGGAQADAVALARLRDSAVKETALAMLKHPETTTTGFMLLAAGKASFGLDETTLQTLAMASYRTMLSAVDHRSPQPASENHYWRDFTPIRRLLADKQSHQPADFLSALPPPARGEMATWLDFFTAPTPAVAATLLQTLARDSQPAAPDNALTLALELAALCQIDPTPGLESLIDHADVAAPPRSSFFDQQAAPQITTLMAGITAHFDRCGNFGRAAPFVARAAARVLGPPACWPLYAAALADGCQENSAIEQRRRTFTAILNLDRIDRAKPDFALVRLGLATGLLGIDGHQPNLPTIDSYCREAGCAGELLSSGLFQPGPGMFLPDGTFLPLKVARLLSDRPEDDPAKTVGTALLAVDGPDRFWARLAGAYWARREAALPLAEVTRELATIRQWPAAEQRALARFLKQRWPDLATTSLAEWLDDALALNLTECETALRQLPDRFAADSVKAAEIPPVLFPLIGHDPRHAAALWLELLTTAPAAAAQRAHRLLLAALLDYPSPHPTVAPANQLAFLLTLLQSNHPAITQLDHGPALAKFLRLLSDSPPLDAKPDPGFHTLIGIRTKAFATLLRCLRDFDDTAAVLLLAPLLEEHSGLCDYNEASCQALLHWLETAIAPDRPQLAHAARLVVRAAQPPPAPPPAIEPLAPTLLAFFTAPSLPPLARLHLLQTACKTLEPLVSSPRITAEMLAILARCELLAILGAGDPPVNLPEMLALTAGLSYADLLDTKTAAQSADDLAQARHAIIRLTLIERTIQATLRAGRTDFWCRQMADLTHFRDLQTQADHYREMERLFGIYGPKFISHALTAPPASHDSLLQEAAAIAANFAILAAPRDHDQRQSISNQCYQFLLLTHLATHRGRDFAACWAALPPTLTQPREATPAYSGALVLECFPRAEFTAADGTNTAPQLFAALLLDPALSTLVFPTMDHLHRLIEANFVTGEEVAAAIEVVPDTHPRKPIYLLGRAVLSGYYENQTDPALADCARAIRLAAAQPQPAIVALAKATQVRILVRGDRYPEAANIAATIDAAQLDDPARQDFVRLREFLQTKPKAK